MERNIDLCRGYMTGRYTTRQLAGHYGISTSMVQRITRQAGVNRSVADANRLMAPLRSKHHMRVRPEYRRAKRQKRHKYGMPKRVEVDAFTRATLILKQPWCTECRRKHHPNNPLQVDHADNDRSNSDPANLQVLCRKCNIAKWQAYRATLPSVIARAEAKRELKLLTEKRKDMVCRMYIAGIVSTEEIARRFSLSTRTVQRIIKEAGVTRPIGETNRLRTARRHSL